MTSTADIRADADAHAAQLAAARFLSARDLAGRWGVDDDTVRAIPRSQLPYLTLGKSNLRRYAPGDVEAYEAANRRGDYEVERPSRRKGEAAGEEARAS